MGQPFPDPSSAFASTDAPASRISIRSLRKKFVRRGDGAEVIPVNNISLEVAPDEILVLLGPSGCGKTTLLRCIAGLEQPDAGEIVIDGRVVFSAAGGKLLPPSQRPISMVFQSYALWPHMTVFENVAYPLRSRGVPGDEVKKRVSETLEMVGLAHLADQHPSRISGGQQQRVALARAVVSRTGVVLFDEPLSNVDAKVRDQLRGEILRMQRALRFSAVYVTHDQIEAMAIGNRIAILNDGRIEQLGTPEEIYRRPASKYVGTFVGSPNVLPAQICGWENGQAIVSTPIGDLRIDAPKAEVTATRSATVLARPEIISLSEGQPATGVNAIACTVEERIFLGVYVEYTVSVGTERMRVWYPRANQLRVGAPAWLTMAPADLVLVDYA